MFFKLLRTDAGRLLNRLRPYLCPDMIEEQLPGGRLDQWRSPIGWDGLPMHRFNPETLRKVMLTMQEEYGVKFRFCHPASTGKQMIEYLEGRRG